MQITTLIFSASNEKKTLKYRQAYNINFKINEKAKPKPLQVTDHGFLRVVSLSFTNRVKILALHSLI